MLLPSLHYSRPELGYLLRVISFHIDLLESIVTDHRPPLVTGAGSESATAARSGDSCGAFCSVNRKPSFQPSARL